MTKHRVTIKGRYADLVIQGNKKCQAAFVLSQKLPWRYSVFRVFYVLVYFHYRLFVLQLHSRQRVEKSFLLSRSSFLPPFCVFSCFKDRRSSNRSMEFRPGLIVLLCFLGFISAMPVKFRDCGKLHSSLFGGSAQVVGVDFETHFDQSRFGAYFYFSKISSVNLSSVKRSVSEQGKPSCLPWTQIFNNCLMGTICFFFLNESCFKIKFDK